MDPIQRYALQLVFQQVVGKLDVTRIGHSHHHSSWQRLITILLQYLFCGKDRSHSLTMKSSKYTNMEHNQPSCKQYNLLVLLTSFSITASSRTKVLLRDAKQASRTLATSSISPDGHTSQSERAMLRSNSTKN